MTVVTCWESLDKQVAREAYIEPHPKVELILWPAGARRTVPLSPWMLFLLAQGSSLVPWQPVRHPGMGNQAAAQILETITANYQACQFPIVCLHSTRNQGASDEDVGGNFQFWFAECLVPLGGWASSCLETHKAPLTTSPSLLVLEPTFSLTE